MNYSVLAPWIIVLLGSIVELYALFIEIPRSIRLRKEFMRVSLRQGELARAWRKKRVPIGTEVVKLRERAEELEPELFTCVAWGYFFLLTGLAMMAFGLYFAIFK